MKLKSCPMCGKKNKNIGINLESSFYKVVCLGCGLQQVDISHRTKEQAIAEWNTRPAEQELLEALKELVRCIKSGDLYQYTASQSWFFPRIIMNNAFEKAKELIEKYESENE